MTVIGLNPGGLSGGDTPAILEAFREQTGVTFPIGWDPEFSYSLFRSAGGAAISPFPLDVVIDKQGVIRYVNREYEAAGMTAVIESLLGE